MKHTPPRLPRERELPLFQTPLSSWPAGHGVRWLLGVPAVGYPFDAFLRSREPPWPAAPPSWDSDWRMGTWRLGPFVLTGMPLEGWFILRTPQRMAWNFCCEFIPAQLPLPSIVSSSRFCWLRCQVHCLISSLCTNFCCRTCFWAPLGHLPQGQILQPTLE